MLCIGTCAYGAAAAAAECPNESLRTQQPYGARLPDCRAYEQVSPADKNSLDAVGAPGYVESAPSGEGVTYVSLAPFPSVPGVTEVDGAGEFGTYMSARGNDAWTTQGLLPPSNPAPTESEVLGWTEDLAKTIVSSREPILAEPPPGAPLGAFQKYVRDNRTRSYEWLVGPGRPYFVDATPDDSHILFEDAAGKVVPGVTDEEEVPFLYEWDESKPPAERVVFVGVVEGAAPEQGTVAGAGPAERGFYKPNTISDDGRRIFFTDQDNGHLYMREPAATKTVSVSAGSAQWRASTPDGSYAIYTEGENLYRFNVGTETREELASGAAGVLGTLGVATDGSYVYFAATGALAGGAEAGKANLYRWHEGATTFIAALKPGGEGDENDWRDGSENGNTLLRLSRVNRSGTTVLFSSKEPLTAYANAGAAEYYLYDATQPTSAGNPLCVSCNPTGATATHDAHLTFRAKSRTGALPFEEGRFLTRNLADDGKRVFFETEEALVRQDTNGQADVYEWEREGEGSCMHSSEGFVPASSGCLYLVSTGQSSEESYFGDASADGSDVFLFTHQRLVGRDQDNNVDVYDVRVGGGIAAQNPRPALPPCSGEACRGAPSSSPLFSIPASATFSGAGNVTPAVTHSSAPPKPKPLTAAQRLAKALKACRTGPRRHRHACEAHARKKYARKAGKWLRARHAAGGHS